ncbi:MAG: ATP-binding protein [Aquabacterium sp.]
MSVGARSFPTRLLWLLALLLALFGSFVAVVFDRDARVRELQALQRLSHGLARHIVEHWPQVTLPGNEAAERAGREAVLAQLMAVNPGVQAYVLDADGRVREYLGAPGMVREHQVDLSAVRAFLAGAPPPLLGTDPMGGTERRLFSAAMFPVRPGDVRPPGYFYVVLDGAARRQSADAVAAVPRWQPTLMAMLAGLTVVLLLGAFALRRLTRPLMRLAARMQAYGGGMVASVPAVPPPARNGDEVAVLQGAFDRMTRRLEEQTALERAQAAAHRETMAGVAHDLRTPLTALHGLLEALAAADDPTRARLLRAALGQSDQVRRLTQQLFELAALQSTDQVAQRERFRLDELVADAVQKFDATADAPAVTLAGPPPGRLEVDGDLQLVERALSNLIDNARRHGRAGGAVRVRLDRDGATAQVVVEDTGPGLPEEVSRRLLVGQSLREPPMQRASGSLGGLGLAIAQRVAQLHGGSLRPLPGPGGGTRLCLALPVCD